MSIKERLEKLGTIDNQVKNALPPAVFGGTVGANLGEALGDRFNVPEQGLKAGAGLGGLLGAYQGTRNINPYKSFLGTNAEAVGAGVLGQLLSDALTKESNVRANTTNSESYHQLNNGRKNRPPRLKEKFNSEKGNVNIGYENASQDRSNLQRAFQNKQKTAGAVSDTASFLSDKWNQHGDKVKNFAKNQWNQNIKPGLRGNKDNAKGNFLADTVDFGTNFAKNHGHEFKSFAKQNLWGGNN